MTKADLQAIRNPSLLLIVILAAAGTAIYYTNQLVVQARQQLARQEVLMKDARVRLQKSGDEKEVIVRYLGAYQQLQRRGFVGEEQRINWLDGLRVTNQQADLFGVDYEIGVQQPYLYAADLNPGQIQLKESVMKLRFRLLHEEDLTRFLGILSRQGAGIYTVDQCSMRRLTAGTGAVRYQPNLSAECQLAWITAKIGASEEQKKP
jgi:hypothetical protein